MGLSFQTARLTVKEADLELSLSERSALHQRIPQILTPAVVENLPPYFHGIDSCHLAQQWLERMLAESRLFLVSSDDRTLMGLLFAYVDNDNDAHIGYLLAQEFWGKGFASELLQGFISEVSNSENWSKLIGGVDQTNIASAKLLKKLGFVERPAEDNGVIFFEYRILS
jgi:RimJ/RimL family protein N-acetyltransferase